MILLVIVAVYTFFSQVVEPNEIGIRQNKFSFIFLTEGFVEEGLEPGLHWEIPLVSEVHTLQRDFQFVHFNDKSDSGDLNLPQLEIPTTDGSKVKTDITMVVRYYEGPKKVSDTEPSGGVEIPGTEAGAKTETGHVPYAKRLERSHGGPGRLVNKYGILPKDQLTLFAITAEEYLKNALSKLSTTDYYNPVLRETAAFAANAAIASEVSPDGIEAWGSLIRRYIYSEKNIDDQIFAKNLQEQTERLNRAERDLQKEIAITVETEAKWEAEIKDLLITGQQNKQVIESEADRYRIERISEGDRLVQEAYASVDKAKSEILATTPGAEIYLGRKMVPLLNTLEGGVVTDIDPYDVTSWVNKLATIQRRTYPLGQ